MDIKKVAIGVSIFVLLPLFIILFIDAIYAEPQYDDYCNYTYYPEKARNPMTNCTYESGTEYQQCIQQGGDPRYTYNESGCEVYDKCDYCRKDYDAAREEYNRNVFFVLVPLGLIIIILGLYLTVDYIGAGLMFGGLFIMFYATIRYFSDLSKLLRAIVVLVELLIIIWIAYKKIEGRNIMAAKGRQSKKK